jgi:hypothetical protein
MTAADEIKIFLKTATESLGFPLIAWALITEVMSDNVKGISKIF